MDGQYDKRKGKKKFFIQCFPTLLFFSKLFGGRVKKGVEGGWRAMSGGEE